MKIIILNIIVLFLTIELFGQSIYQLETDILGSTGNYTQKIDKARKLQIIDPFNKIAIRHILEYYEELKIDSITIYFDNLIESHPNKVEPIVLRVELLFLEYDYKDRSIYTKNKILYLDSAYTINKHDKRVLFLLTETYYKDFIVPTEIHRNPWDEGVNSSNLTDDVNKESVFEHAADSALHYSYKLWNNDPEIRDVIYFPIKQVECYLNKASTSPIPLNARENFDHCYFPSWYFSDLAENWQCDFTINYLFEIGLTKQYPTEWIKEQLLDLNEPCIFPNHSENSSIIYRLTWLRTFHNPIVVGIKQIKNKYKLYWKVGRGSGGYEPRGLKKQGIRSISTDQLNYFDYLIDSLNFNSLPNESDTPILDGHLLTIEKKNGSFFKAHSTNDPSKQFEEACLYLLELTGLNYGKYGKHGYWNYRIYLRDNDKLVSESVLLDTILVSINKYLNKNIHQTTCCCYYNFILTFNKKGHIRKVVYQPYYNNWFENFWENLKDKRCRNEFKDALKNISLSQFEISSSFKVFAKFNVDKNDLSLEYY